MRVLLLRQEPNARARVHAVALSTERPDVDLALARQGDPGGEGLAREWQLGDRPARGLREAIAGFSPDVIHSYGPSAELTVCANELTAGRVPVVHDLSGKRRFRGDPELEGRAVEESAALVVASPVLLEQVAARYTLPTLTMVFPSYSPARELPRVDRPASAEANIDRLAALYQALTREPMASLAAELRGR
ncbi:MAG TPA: hypothetical protein VGI67_09300 [Thermoleophilaceae bacterium]|jgi:hypothetical protein